MCTHKKEEWEKEKKKKVEIRKQKIISNITIYFFFSSTYIHLLVVKEGKARVS